MKHLDSLHKYAVYLIALITFLAAALAYCGPQSGKVIAGSDNDAYLGAAHESYAYAAKNDGKGAWWTGSMFSGMPNYQIGGGARFKAAELLDPIDNLLHVGIHSHVWALFSYFTCFFILLLAFGISPWISIFGALTIGLSTYFITLIPAGHNTKIAAIALTAVVLAGYKLIFDKKYILGAILTMVFVASGYHLHPQMFYYYCMIIGMLWLAELWIHMKEGRWKELVVATAIFVAAAGIGAGTGCAKMLVNKEYVTESTRGGSVLENYLQTQNGTLPSSNSPKAKGLNLDYLTEWSYGKDETFSLLIPRFKGGCTYYPLDPEMQLCKDLKKQGYHFNQKEIMLYWGPQAFTYGNTYVGAIVCFLFLLGLLIVKGPYKWMLFACTVFSILLAWGGNFMWLTELFYKYFPMYGKFRAVSSILVVAEITMPLLGLLAVKEILDGKVEKHRLNRSVLISAGITVGTCLFFAMASGSLYDFTSSHDNFPADMPQNIKDAIFNQRHAILQSDCFRSIFFIAAAAILITVQTKWKKRALPIFMIIGLLSVVDLWGIDHKYFNKTAFTTPKHLVNTFKKKNWEKEILQDNDPHFRVYNTTTDTFNDPRTSFYLKSVGGYSAAKLSRYNDLINVHLSNNHPAVFNMLNTKYIIAHDKERGGETVMLNKGALGNAWFVSDLKWVDNPKDEIYDLTEVDLANIAVVNEEFKPIIEASDCQNGRYSEIHLTEYRPDHLSYECSAPVPGVAVFSEIYYPHGWIARIDGKEEPHFRADYLLRAIKVPEGQHTITFDFDPQSVKIGDGIATFFVIVMYASIAAAAVYAAVRIRKRKLSTGK